MTKQQDDTRHGQLTEDDSHQFGVERNVPNFESTGDFSEDSDGLLSIGIGDNYPGDESESNSYESIPDRRDEEKGLS